MTAHTAADAVDAIIADFTDRRGLRQEWERIDAGVKGEIRAEWLAIVQQCIDENMRERTQQFREGDAI